MNNVNFFQDFFESIPDYFVDTSFVNIFNDITFVNIFN